MTLVREPDAGNRPVRFDERGVETEHGRDTVTLATERASNREYKLRPKPPRHFSTLPFCPATIAKGEAEMEQNYQ